MTATGVQVRKEALPFRVAEPNRIIVKVSILVHVINISPDP